MKKPFSILILLFIILTGCKKTSNDDNASNHVDNITEFSIVLLPDNSVEMRVPLESPGTLNSFISINDKKHISILRVSGVINGDDIQTIRGIMEYQKTVLNTRLFKTLDLSGCDFTTGGHFLYPKRSYENNNGEVVTLIDSIWVSPSDSHVIPPYAFAQVDLQSIIISTSISAIGEYAFEYNSIRDFNIPSSVKSIGKGAFHFTYIQNAITISEGVTALPDSVFFNASQIPSLILPSTIRSMGKRCLGDCLHLSEIIIKSKEPPACDDTLWDDWYIGSRTLYVPHGSIEKYRSHPVWGRADIITEIKQ